MRSTDLNSKLTTIPMLTIALLVLTACGDSTVRVEAPTAPVKPPVAFVVPCKDPVKIPERDLTQADVEKMWATDRDRLRNCSARHAAVITWYDERDADLSKD